jgi:hypothetical protein
MKNKEFFDAEHANRYLSDSIIRLDGEPIYCFGVDQRSRGRYIYYVPMIYRNQEEKSVLLNSKDIDMNPVPLGFVNFTPPFSNENEVYSVFRTPERAWKVGLNHHNMFVMYGGSRVSGDMDAFSNLLKSKGLRDTIVGKFPSFDKAQRSLKSGARQVAFSRRFALRNNKLFYIQLQKAVGELKKNGVLLFDDFTYLSQALTEDCNENP